MEGVQVKTEPSFEAIFIPDIVEHAVKVEQVEPTAEETTSVHKKSRRLRNLKCAECKIKYVDPEMLVWHAENFHGAHPTVTVVDEDYQCNFCQTLYKDVFEFIRHLRYQHKVNKLPFPCNTCEKSFAERKNRNKHQGNCKNVRRNCVRTEKCKECNVTFVHAEMLTWHTENLHGKHPTLRPVKRAGDNQYQCVFCRMNYKDLHEAISHLRSKHQLAKLPYQCKICPLQFVTRASAMKHQSRCKKNKTGSPAVHHSREEKVQQSTEEMFTSEIEIVEHPVKPEPEEQDCQPTDATVGVSKFRVLVPKLLECDSCSFCSNKKTKLAAHIQAHHTPNFSSGGFIRSHERRKLNVKCAECGVRYAHPDMLLWHTEYFHGSGAIVKVARLDEKKLFSFQCLLCQDTKYRTIDILRHLMHQHRVSKLPFQCSLCGKTFSCIFTLQHHSCRVTVEANNLQDGVKCRLCNREFDSEARLKEHVSHFHATKIQQHFQCLHCAESFRFRTQLFTHCNSRHPGQQVLQCDVCGLGIVTYATYFMHKKYQHAGAKFSCDICSFTGASPANLRQHMARMHSQETWSCILCKATFRCKAYLSRHVKLGKCI